MKKVGIIGLGLIGGSLAKALKKRADFEIIAFNRSEEVLISAYNEGIVSIYSGSDLTIFRDCDLIFICTPVDKITSYVDRLLPIIKKDCVITDVGSTKANIFSQMLEYKETAFIGGHPMAGSEQIGYKAAKEYLFENAYYVITPTPYVNKEQIDEFIKIIEILGALPIVIDAQEHDNAVAAISHVPHVIAAALVNMVKRLDNNRNLLHTLAAGGFKDITRIASSSPEMWSSISIENKQEVLKIIKDFKNTIVEFEKELEEENADNIYSFYESSKNYRDGFSSGGSSISKTFSVLVDVFDKPGIIATISTMLSVNNINIKNIGISNNREYSDGILQIVLDNEEDRKKSINLLREMNFVVYSK